MKIGLVLFAPFLLAAGLYLQTHGPEPPDGWFCSHEATDDHHCECQRTCQPKMNCDEEGNCTPAGGMEVREDPDCKVYCYKSHCACKVKGCEHTS